ncbi:MAG: acyltransferase, partial [Alphaproteobacteria bacterium]|nr:acyltransferase [Alphaproteobacteria bacterium]
MTRKNHPRFDVDALHDHAGATVFARGESYFRGGQVELLAVGPDRVLAEGGGTEDYPTVRTGRGEEID